jgi:hypothetical protein
MKWDKLERKRREEKRKEEMKAEQEEGSSKGEMGAWGRDQNEGGRASQTPVWAT